MLAHRGISSVLMRFSGRAGHASSDNASTDSAVHQAIRWGARALDFVETQAHARFGGLTGLRFNIGRIEGGIKANMIAPAAELRFGFRPLPSMDTDALLDTLPHASPSPPPPSSPKRSAARRCRPATSPTPNRVVSPRAIVADALGIPIGNAVDFWTEASLFSQAGYDAFVFGPGDIAQAHAADEWVALVAIAALHRNDHAPHRGRTRMNADAHIQIRQTIVRLLSSMASSREIDQYLKRFAQLDAKRFAVVKVGGAVLRDDLDALTSSLAFLQQVGLTPIVVHGAGPQLDDELDAAGIAKQTIDGLRVTSPETLAIVRRVFQAQNLRLVEALQEVDARATSIVSGVFEAEFIDRDALGLVGRVVARRSRADRGEPARRLDSGHRLARRNARAGRSSTSTPISPRTSWCAC